MDPQSLDYRAIALLDRVTAGLSQYHGSGCMSVALYDTAWVALISKPIGPTKTWLFPQSFKFLLDTQQDDGGWTSYASQIDGILNTAASLLALKKHHAEPLQLLSPGSEDLSHRIEKATSALQHLLDSWNVEDTVHVGFEILVPALLDYLQDEGIALSFRQGETLSALNRQKLRKFQPEFLYGPYQLTALHSLEAFVGKIEFDRVAHHKISGSFMASPSSTSAYLINASTWDDECEDYLRHVLAYGAGERQGGVPSAFPSTIFELTWSMSTLLEAGFDLSSLSPYHTSKAAHFLTKQLADGEGALGFAPGLGADADDTSKAMLILNMLDQEVSLEPLLKHFEGDSYFKTYPLERDPSFSANCNVLVALLHAPRPSHHSAQIGKVTRFLLSIYQEHGLNIRDKWNISPFYSLMLLAQAGERLLYLARTGELPALPHKMLDTQIPGLLAEIVRFTLQSQKVDGTWGTSGSMEETAYALSILSTTIASPTPSQMTADTSSAIMMGRQALSSASVTVPEYLWVEKVTYTSEILSESYILAALKATSGVAVLAGLDLTSVSESADAKTIVNETDRHDKADSGIGSSRGSPVLNGTCLSSGDDAAQDAIEQASSKSLTEPLEDKAHQPRSEAQKLGGTHAFDDWDPVKEKILLGPYTYLERNPGKDMRSQFIQSFNVWLKLRPEQLAVIERVVRMLHTASLLVDDIEDNSDLRRGRPVAHSIFGTAQTLNAGNYVYFLALDEVRKLNNPQAIDIFIEELICLHRGQGMDLYWRDSLICPTEVEYLQMVGNKTGGLFRLAIRLMQSESNTGRDFLPLVNILGLQFQIVDDYLNLMSTTYEKNKGLCEDLTEGKFSFPVIHSIRSDPSNKELINILKQKPREAEVKQYAVKCMRTTGSFQYAREVVTDLGAKAMGLIDIYEAQGWGEGVGVRKLLARMSLD